MGIKVRFGEGTSLIGRKTDFYFACDYCGEEITLDAPGNFECEEKDGSPAYFLHKECTSAFRVGKPRRIWDNLVSITIKVK